ncbi:ATP-grasp fold amidoligase family protein [Amphibacillus indicireducens]|uniref:ATP-grasp domain-containing protein n=1 Tax=Amphibacillus indicireducens TaxID=1076330 RepID=A0ABP7VKC6_9BACI
MMDLNKIAKEEQMAHTYQEELTLDKLTRETIRLEKDIKHIKESRRFKLSKILRPFSYVKIYFSILFRGRAIHQENIMLKQELLKKQYLLNQQKSQLNFINRAIEGLKKLDINSEGKIVKLLNQEGWTFDFIDKLVDEEQKRQEQIKRIIDQLTRSHRHLKSEELKNYLYEKTALLYKRAQFPEYLIRQYEQRNISGSHLDSFSDQLVKRFRLKQLTNQLPETILDDKKTAYRFVEQLTIPYPKQHDHVYTIKTIPKKNAIVIKPAFGDGGRGVYLIKDETNIFDIKRERQLFAWSELIEAMTDDLKSGKVSKDLWYCEELLRLNEEQPARDLKFYCFYGEVGLILEVDRTTKARYCWWDKRGERIQTGKYEKQQFEGLGVVAKEIDQALKLSLQIPAPFMRIDFLRTDKGLYFGEFTPKPGNFDQFDLKTDQKLGQLYLEAEARLNTDLINGKKFTLFDNIIEDIRRNA